MTGRDLRLYKGCEFDPKSTAANLLASFWTWGVLPSRHHTLGGRGPRRMVVEVEVGQAQPVRLMCWGKEQIGGNEPH